MDFEDLHDPHPPRPGPDTMAAVAARARRLRRRRVLVVTAGAAAVMAAIVVPVAFVVSGNDSDSDRIVPATVPDIPPQPTPAPTVSTVPTSVAAPLPTSVAPPPPPTSPTSPATAAAFAPPVVAIGVDGDAVLIDDGVETLLYDGADPQVRPEEGELTTVDRVVRTLDGRTFVSTCCEPVPGVYYELGADGQPIAESVVYGHGIALSPDGTRIASVGASGITVADLDANVMASVDLAGREPDRRPQQVMWLDDRTLVVAESWLTTTAVEMRLVVSPADLVSHADLATMVVDLGEAAQWHGLAGLGDDGSISSCRTGYSDGVPTTLRAYDPVTLERRPEGDVTLPGPSSSAWLEDGVVTWIELGGIIRVDETTLPGRLYAWARPVG